MICVVKLDIYVKTNDIIPQALSIGNKLKKKLFKDNEEAWNIFLSRRLMQLRHLLEWLLELNLNVLRLGGLRIMF